jgi:acyl-CoA reductase-like NAD-dependent aldehyde dehydrogenase
LLVTAKIAPMLASGCTAVVKPAELTPLSALKIAEIWTNIKGAPPGVINMVPGMGDVAGEAIVDHSDVRKISFTGSTEKGRRVMQRSSKDFKRLVLELGGKGPFIVFNDANIDKAAYLANYLGTLSNGQFCGCPSRLIVQEGVYDQFIEKVAAHMKAQKIGRFDEPGVTNGPVISQK